MNTTLYHKDPPIIIYRSGLPASSRGIDENGDWYLNSYYKVGIARLEDWIFDPAWAGGGYFKAYNILSQKSIKMSYQAVLSWDDHNVVG